MRKPLWTLGALHHSPRALADADSAEMRLPIPGGDHNNNGCGWAMGVDGQGQKTCTVNSIFGNPPTLDCPTQPQHLLLPSPALHHSASPLPTYSHSPPLPHCSPPFTSTPYYTTQPQHIQLPSPSPLSLTPAYLLPLAATTPYPTLHHYSFPFHTAPLNPNTSCHPALHRSASARPHYLLPLPAITPFPVLHHHSFPVLITQLNPSTSFQPFSTATQPRSTQLNPTPRYYYSAHTLPKVFLHAELLFRKHKHREEAAERRGSSRLSPVMKAVVTRLAGGGASLRLFSIF